MADSDAIRISSRLELPRGELSLRATRSSGPGGQHVNTSSTRIELVWDVTQSPSLNDSMRATLLRRLASRLDTSGRLRLVSQAERSQFRNREEVIERFTRMIASALVEPKVRRATKPTKGSKERRITAKKRRGELKRDRRQTGED
ncbi:MAG: aminoacyl-tRNA hydrolase [Gemmatimonadales bacterium]|nr:aminoacyl-tRNA hydrolase [Gemmatimonadales bacterium]